MDAQGEVLGSIATQILVIFLIRTRRLPWRATPAHIVLITTSLGALAAAFFLVTGPVQRLFGFVPLTWPLIVAMAAVTVSYLAAAEVARHFALRGSPAAGGTLDVGATPGCGPAAC